MGFRRNRLARRSIALVFKKTSIRTRSAFEVAAHDEGGHEGRTRTVKLHALPARPAQPDTQVEQRIYAERDPGALT
jgi:ornithine carbamoyltransferase